MQHIDLVDQLQTSNFCILVIGLDSSAHRPGRQTAYFDFLYANISRRSNKKEKRLVSKKCENEISKFTTRQMSI